MAVTRDNDDSGAGMLVSAKDRREEILTIATELFQEKGYRSTSLQDIAQVIGFTKQAIYYYFPSKEDILYTIHSRIIAAALERVRAIRSSEEQPRDAIQRALAEHVGTLLAHLGENIVFNQEREFLSPERKELIKQQEREYNLVLREIYRDGIASGTFHDLDPAIAINTLLGACNSVYRWYRPGGRLSAEAIVRIITDLLSRGFLVASS